MTDILELIGSVIWIALAIYFFTRIRRLNRRMDAILSDIERDLHHGQ